LDVTKPEQVQVAANSLRDVNLVINNAGIFPGSTLASDDLFALARESMETNYFGCVAVTKAFAPILAANGGGALVNVLSAAWTSVPGYLPYGPSKAAALMFTTAIRDELKAQGTQVTAILAGPIDTEKWWQTWISQSQKTIRTS
jgi:NAD(P)-dependent dehydrogenase (short-subunit alcohol dehydrogenase family)